MGIACSAPSSTQSEVHFSGKLESSASSLIHRSTRRREEPHVPSGSPKKTTTKLFQQHRHSDTSRLSATDNLPSNAEATFLHSHKPVQTKPKFFFFVSDPVKFFSGTSQTVHMRKSGERRYTFGSFLEAFEWIVVPANANRVFFTVHSRRRSLKFRIPFQCLP